MEVILILFLLFFISGCFLPVIRVRFYSPISIHCLVWGGVTFVGLLVGGNFIDIPSISAWAIIIWFFTVYFGLLIFEFISLHDNENTSVIKYNEFSTTKKPLLWPLVLIVVFFSAWEVYTVGCSGEYSFLLNLRLSLILEYYNGPKLYYTILLYPFLTALYAISVYYEGAISKNSVSLFLWQLVFCIGTAGKFAIITPFLILTVIGLYKDSISKRVVFVLSVIILVLMILLHLMRMSDDTGAQIPLVLGTYIYSPLLALGVLTQQASAEVHHFGEYTFRFIYAVLYKMNLGDIEPKETILDYVYVPLPTNVYSVMQPFYSDFGLLGVFCGALFYALFFGGVFRYVKKRGGGIHYHIFNIICEYGNLFFRRDINNKSIWKC